MSKEPFASKKSALAAYLAVSEKDICSDLFDLKLTAECLKIFGLSMNWNRLALYSA